MKNLTFIGLISFLFLFFTSCAPSSSEMSEENYVEYDFEESEYDGVFRELIDSAFFLSGIPKVNIRVEYTMRNEISSSFHQGSGTRVLHVNGDFLDQVKENGSDTVLLSIIFHEIGHILYGHSFDKRGNIERREMELQADYYSGYQMRIIGASLAQSLMGLNIFKELHGRGDYPTLEERELEVTRGYNAANSILH